jgi:hypothetical protein
MAMTMIEKIEFAKTATTTIFEEAEKHAKALAAQDGLTDEEFRQVYGGFVGQVTVLTQTPDAYRHLIPEGWKVVAGRSPTDEGVKVEFDVVVHRQAVSNYGGYVAHVQGVPTIRGMAKGLDNVGHGRRLAERAREFGAVVVRMLRS